MSARTYEKYTVNTDAAVAAKISTFLARVKIAKLVEKRPENIVIMPSRMTRLFVKNSAKMDIAGSIAATDMTITLAANASMESLYSIRPLDVSPEIGFWVTVSSEETYQERHWLLHFESVPHVLM